MEARVDAVIILEAIAECLTEYDNDFSSML